MSEGVSPLGKSGSTVDIESVGTKHRVSGRGSRHHRSSLQQKKILKLQVVSWVLGALLVATIIGWILIGSSLSLSRHEMLEYETALRQESITNQQLIAKAGQLEGEIARLEKEVDALVQGRIPNLKPLEFDVTVTATQQYFKNISFNLTGTTINKKYEYRAVLNNDSSKSVNPDVTIFLFDDLGVQVGMTELSLEDATSIVENSTLKPGESRAYSNTIQLNRDAEPGYFLINVR